MGSGQTCCASATALRLLVPRKQSPVPLLQVLAHEFQRLDAKRFGELHQLDGIDPTLPPVALGNEGLGVFKALGQLDLRHAHALTDCLEDGQQELIVGVVGRLGHRAVTRRSVHAKVRVGLVQNRLFIDRRMHEANSDSFTGGGSSGLGRVEDGSTI